jgi:hypothetical protein
VSYVDKTPSGQLSCGSMPSLESMTPCVRAPTQWGSTHNTCDQCRQKDFAWESFAGRLPRLTSPGREAKCTRLLDIYAAEKTGVMIPPDKTNGNIRIVISDYLRLCHQAAVGIASGGTLNLTAKSSNSLPFVFTVVTNGCSGYADASRLRKVTNREYRSRKYANKRAPIRTYLQSSSASPFLGLKPAATTLAASVSASSCPPCCKIASSRSDFASCTSPRSRRVTPRAVRRWGEERDGLASCSV